VTHICIRKDVVNGRGMGVRYDVAAGGRDVVVESKVRVGTRDTASDIATEESFPPGLDTDLNHASAGACGFATEQVTFDLLDVRRQRPQMWEQTSDGVNFPRSFELAY
jgi:hypothetical protein